MSLFFAVIQPLATQPAESVLSMPPDVHIIEIIDNVFCSHHGHIWIHHELMLSVASGEISSRVIAREVMNMIIYI